MTHYNAQFGQDLIDQIVIESELNLAKIENGWEPPCTSKELEIVYDDAIRAFATDLPDPEEVCADLVQQFPGYAEAIVRAYRANEASHRGMWRVDDAYAKPLQRLGLVCVGGPYLGEIGNQVRKILQGEYL